MEWWGGKGMKRAKAVFDGGMTLKAASWKALSNVPFPIESKSSTISDLATGELLYSQS